MTSVTPAFEAPAQPEGYEAFFADTLTRINEALARYLNSPGSGIVGPERLWEAMRYATLDAGKRIRPVLAVETCLACGGDVATVLPAACAIEMVHAQSLIHDDLPCMDDDDLRRGKPTLHRAFDEATAVLAGDALLAMAFGVLGRHTPQSEAVRPGAILDVLSDFSDVSSVRGLVNGQFVDIWYEGRPYTPEVLDYIHTYKTGALFRFSLRTGAILAGAPDKTVAAFTGIGEQLGLAFQIVDDLLDVQSTPEALGKTPGKDVASRKATYPALYGLSASRDKAEALITSAQTTLDSLPGVDGRRLRVLFAYISQRIH